MGHMQREDARGAGWGQGLMAGTRIAVAIGWRPVEALRPGDGVLTFAGGVRPIEAVRAAPLPADLPEALWPLVVPPGALDNREALWLLPRQRLLVEADCAEALYGDPFVLVPAAALEGWRGIARQRPQGGLRTVSLHFAEPQIIYAGCGALIATAGAPHGHAVLGLAEGERVIALLMAEEVGAMLRARARVTGHGRGA